MTRDPQTREMSSESVSTPSMSKRMAVTGGAAAAEAEAAKAEGGTAAAAVEVGGVGVEGCREKRFCRGGACAEAEPLLPAAVPPPRPVVLLLLLRPIPLTASPNIHAPVMSRFFELKKRREERSKSLCFPSKLSHFFFFLARCFFFLSFPSFPSFSPLAFSHDGRHGASNCLHPLKPGPLPPAPEQLVLRKQRLTGSPLSQTRQLQIQHDQIAARSSMASTSASAGRRSAPAASPRRAVSVRATEEEKRGLDFQPSQRSVSSRSLLVQAGLERSKSSCKAASPSVSDADKRRIGARCPPCRSAPLPAFCWYIESPLRGFDVCHVAARDPSSWSTECVSERPRMEERAQAARHALSRALLFSRSLSLFLSLAAAPFQRVVLTVENTHKTLSSSPFLLQPLPGSRLHRRGLGGPVQHLRR